jgi:hypothetical protein
MERFFAKPTPQMIVDHIYTQVLLVHETGGSTYRYSTTGYSLPYVTKILDGLGALFFDIDVLAYECDTIIIDWS